MPGPPTSGTLDLLLDVTVGKQTGNLLAHCRGSDAQTDFQLLNRLNPGAARC